jgi:hypothetical protein
VTQNLDGSEGWGIYSFSNMYKRRTGSRMIYARSMSAGLQGVMSSCRDVGIGIKMSSRMMYIYKEQGRILLCQDCGDDVHLVV